MVDEAIIQASQTTAIFNKAQALRKLRLIRGGTPASYLLSASILDRFVPWHQLTELDLRLNTLGSPTVYWLLSRCTSLQIFIAYIDCRVPDPLMEVLVLPCLRSLTLSLPSHRIFDYLVTPTLTKLYLRGLEDSSTHTAIANMLSRSRCLLSVFDAGGRVGSNAPAIQALLARMPAVRIFKGVGLFVDAFTLGTIALVRLLLSATTLSCDLSHLRIFFDMLMLRSRQTGKTVALRSSVGYGKWTGGAWPCSESCMEAVVIRIREINKVFGTQHSLEWEPDPSRKTYPGIFS